MVDFWPIYTSPKNSKKQSCGDIDIHTLGGGLLDDMNHDKQMLNQQKLFSGPLFCLPPPLHSVFCCNLSQSHVVRDSMTDYIYK